MGSESKAGVLPSPVDAGLGIDRSDRVFPECVGLLWSNSESSQVLVLLAAMLLAAFEWNRVEGPVILQWLGYLLAVTLYRLVLARYFTQQQPGSRSVAAWHYRFLLGVTLSGLGWGIAGLLFVDPGDLPSALPVLLMLVGLAAAAAPYLAPSLAAFVIYVCLVLAPLAGKFFLAGNATSTQVGVMTVVYLLALVMVARRMNRSVVTSLDLRFENASLVEFLTQAKRRLETTNADLRAEIGQRRTTEQTLVESLSMLQATLEATADGILVVDNGGRIVSHNQQFLRMWNIPESVISTRDDDTALGYVLDRLVDPKGFLRRVNEVYRDPAAESHDILEFKDGRVFERNSKPQRIEGRCVGRVWCFREITERRRVERDLHFIANHDPLTALPNRTRFYHQLNAAIARKKVHPGRFAVLFIDLDRFKNVNDTLGYDAGDRLLKDAAQRLRETLRDSDLVARLGGDEFVVLLSDCEETQQIANVAQKILDAFEDSFVLDGREIRLSASIGISSFPDDGENSSSLLKSADIAMYRAKDQGRSTFQFYSSQMNLHSEERLAMESKLLRAIERNEFTVHYQPKVDLRQRRIVGVEALVRWRHPELGVVSPATFIPLAEETGLIVRIGDWVLRTACAQMREFQDRGLPPLRVAVNLSGRQFAQAGLVSRVFAALDETGLDARQLELEITESMVMVNADQTIAALWQMKERGIGVSIDDFGTGYSSLGYLKRFPIDSLKIDRSFVLDLPHDPDDAAITQAVIAMAHSLGLRVVAEGVEKREQLEFLRAHRCDEIQGYIIARPMPADDLARLLAGGLDVKLR